MPRAETTGDELVRVEDHEHVRVVVFNRPEVLNAFNTPLYRAVAGAIGEAKADDEVRVLVLTGEGRAFSSGQDLKEMEQLATSVGTDDGGTTDSGFPDLLDAVQGFDKPLLAAVNGLAIGIGFTLLPHCDLVLVSDDAALRVPFAEHGVPPEAASSYLFPMRMGWQRAAQVLFASPWVSAAEAVEYGIALEAQPADRLLPRTLELAREIAVARVDVLRAIKTTMQAGHRDAIAAARAREEAAFPALLAGFTRD